MSVLTNKFFKFLAASLIAIFAVGSLSACSSPEPVDMATYAEVIDVRTPEETASGYLEGALLFDINGGMFAEQISTLDKSANYFVYCRSGNRAGGAIDQMKAAGFTGELTNGGSLADAASATGLAIVQ
jgi:rhodanese-related sulfurtransferase